MTAERGEGLSGSFFQSVYDVVRQVPFGRFSSYGFFAE